MRLVVVEGARTRIFADGEFPVAVSLASDGTLRLGAEAERAAAAWILSHSRGLSLQPERTRVPVTYDGALLDQAAWLQPGGKIGIGPLVLAVDAGDDQTLILRGAAESIAQSAAHDDTDQVRRFAAPFGAPRRGEGRRPATAKRIALALFAVLVLGATYVIAASPVYLRITPEPDSVSWSGFPPPLAIGGRYLVFPGDYVVEAEKEGYVTARQPVSVVYGASPTVELALRKLPGRLQITTAPAVEGATIVVDGVERGAAPLSIEVEAGEREIRVVSNRYLAEPHRLEVRGMGEVQEVAIAVRPAWGTLSVTSVPDKALVKLDGKEIGETPLEAEALQGGHEVEISKPGWKPVTRPVEIQASERTTLPPITLERIDGTLELASEPRGATVTVDGQFRGRTPLSLSLVGERPYELEVSLAGYESTTRRVRVEGGASTRLAIPLQPELGTVFLTVSPPGSAVKINGRDSGSGSQRLTLQTVPQTIEVTRPGYEPFKTSVTPQRDVPKRIEATLKTVGDALKDRAAKGILTPGGQRLVLVYFASPVRFTMGSPRREAGRRSNEVEYPVQLTRSYLISEKEVTNAEFRKFRASHNSGAHSVSLDEPDQPVVNVSWEDAARYANWLSAQEGLAPAYKEENGKLVPVAPLTNGYRLPTEAEWEYAARFDGGRRPATQPLAFPWGEAMPPPANSGNYAQEGSQLPFAMPGYVDAYPASAPVGKFAPGRSMIYDLGGNVAEWCHDYYDVPAPSDTPKVDPAGPPTGRFHVIKGASWRSGTIAELRLAYRDYAEKARDDLGFRVVRYVDTPR